MDIDCKLKRANDIIRFAVVA